MATGLLLPWPWPQGVHPGFSLSASCTYHVMEQWYVVFCWLPSLGVLRVLVPRVTALFLLMAEYYSPAWTYHIFTRPSVSEHEFFLHFDSR